MAGRSVECLLADVAFALEQGLGPRDLLPMLKKLVHQAQPGSVESRFARLCLARHLLDSEPFRAARYCRALTHEEPTNDEAWGLYGVSLTVLGHFRAAKKALVQACRLAPEHPGHAHNLGHLLDLGFNEPEASLPWLRRAFAGAKDVPGIASSYAHALSRTGHLARARELLCSHGGMDAKTAAATLEEWSKPPKVTKT